MNTTIGAASCQASLVQASFTSFSAISVENSLAGMSVQKNNGSYTHIPTPVEYFGERVLKPAVDSLSYWASRSIELLNNFLSLPGADAAQVGQNQTGYNQTAAEHPVVSRIDSLTNQFNGDVSTAKEREAKRLFVPHAETLLSLAKKEKVVHPKVGLLATELGNFFRLTGNLSIAQTYCEQGINAYAAAYGTENHVSVATAYTGLANVLKTEGHFWEAKMNYERALSILFDQHKRENHPDIGLIYNNLSIVFLNLGNKATARMFADKAVSVQYAVYGADGHINLASALNSLGNVQKSQGDFVGAKTSFLESLRVRKALPEAEHETHTGVTYNNLGIVLQAQGDFAGAKKYFQEAIRLKTESYGEGNHSELGITYSSLASLLQAEGDLDGAEIIHKKALKIFIACYGPKHPNVAISLNSLGIVLTAQKNLEGAQKYFEKGVAIQEDLKGNPYSLAGSYKNLANVLKQQGYFEKAKEAFQKSIDSYIAAHKTKNHKDVVTGYISLGDTCFTLKQFHEAKFAYEKAKQISHKLFENQHDEFFNSRIQQCERRA